MKALILAAGRGKRLDDLSVKKNKCMLKINGVSVIEYSLNYAVSIEPEEIIIIVGYRAEEIINTYGNKYKQKKVKYVIQQEQKGLVHALESAKEAISGDDFALFLGDEILLNPKHQIMLNKFKDEDMFTVCGILTVEDRNFIRRTYTLIQSEENIIYRLVEKPRTPLNNFMGTGNCIFKNEIFNYIEITPLHHERKEKELPDLIQCAIDDGKVVKSFIICDKYTNINSEEDIKIAQSFFK